MGPHDARRPLGAWSELVAAILRMPGALGCEPESLSYLARLTEQEAAPAAHSRDAPQAEYLFARIRLSLLDLVSAVASESCPILLIEDTQWMDDWSWDVVRALTKRLATMGMLVLMTRRDGVQGATPVPPDADIRGMPIAPLDDASCRELFALAGPASRTAEPDFVEWCVRTSGGNPYFLIELGRRAARTGGRFQAPPSLTSLIAQRYLDVAPLSRRILQAAAVLGRNSTLPRLERVLGERPLSLLDGLDELSRHSLILSDGVRVLCRHDLLGMSALTEIAPLSLQLLHRQAAAALASEMDETSTPALLWDTAQHWESAGDLQRAIALLDRCAARAMILGAPAEAARVLDHMLPLLEAGDARDAVRRRRIHALFMAQEYSRVVQAAEADRADGYRSDGAEGEHTPEELYELEARLSSIGPMGLIARALTCTSGPAATPEHRVGAGLIGIMAAHAVGDGASARQLFENVRSVLPVAPPTVALQFRLVYEGTFGSVTRSAAAARQLLHVLEGPRDWLSRSRALLRCTMALQLDGDQAGAKATIAEAIELATKLEMPSAIQRATQLLVSLLMEMGDLDAADTAIASLGDLEKMEAGPYTRGFLHNRIELALLRGDFAAAERLLGPFDDLWGGDYARDRQFVVQARARFLLRARGWVPTQSDMERLMELHHAEQCNFSHDSFVMLLVEAFNARGEIALAEPLVRNYVTRFRRERSPLLRQLRELLERLTIQVPEVPREGIAPSQI